MRLTAALLALLWLPAALHCQLEGADIPFLTHDLDHDDAPDHDHGTSTEDEHHAFKDTPIAASKLTTKILPPDHVPFLVLLAHLATGRDALVSRLSPKRHLPPLKLTVAWQFIVRAALPARAPSLNS